MEGTAATKIVLIWSNRGQFGNLWLVVWCWFPSVLDERTSLSRNLVDQKPKLSSWHYQLLPLPNSFLLCKLKCNICESTKNWSLDAYLFSFYPNQVSLGSPLGSAGFSNAELLKLNYYRKAFYPLLKWYFWIFVSFMMVRALIKV